MGKTFQGIIAYILAIFFIFAMPVAVFAETLPAGTINAGMLQSLWYSDLSAEDGRTIDVHGAIQNNSGIAFTGTAVLYVDDVSAGEKGFSSEPDSLKDISIPWKATAGKHVFQMKVRASIPADKELLSYKSDLSYMSVSKVVTFATIKDSVVGAVSSVASQAEEKADDVADAIIKKLELVKQDGTKAFVSKSNPTVSGNGSASGGAGAKDDASSDGPPLFSNPQTAAVFNSGIDMLSFLVDQWKWSLSVLALFALFVFFKSRSVF